ncbi:MAG: MFS transporter [Myxococcales bacterium]|nr:MAG: MFS transporter [Myxococcales bacterium]
MTKPPPRLAVLLLIYAAFVSMGLPDGILGAAWPQMRAELSVALNDNWPMLALGTCGSALSNFSSGAALRRLGVGRVLVLTTFLTALVILGYALAGSFAVLSALGFFLGLGNGAIDAGLNHFASAKLSSRHMSWLHGFWGVGVSLGTLLLSSAVSLGGTWRHAYLVIALVQLALGGAFVFGRGALPGATPRVGEPQASHPPFSATFRLPVAWASMAAFFVYCGLESAAGLWIASVLHDGRGWTTQAAGLMTTLYWASLTVGRFLIGAVSTRVSSGRIVQASTLGALVGTATVALSSALVDWGSLAGALTALGLLVTGLSLAPVFPMLMHDTPRSVGEGHALNLIGFQGAAGQLGLTLLPIAIGTVLRVRSTEWLGSLLAALSLLLLTLLKLREHFTAQRSARRAA